MKAAAGLLLSALLVAGPLRADVLEQVLVKVNGEIFTKTELEARQVQMLREKMQQKVDAEALKNDVELKKALIEITPQILVDAIDEMLLVQLGKEKGYHLSDDQFKNWLDNLRKTQNLTDDQKFQQALTSEGMTVDDLRRNVEKSFLVQQVQRDEVGSKLQITEEEARQYYQAHKEEFAEPATVTLREILIEVPTTTVGGKAGVNVGQEDEVAKQAAEIRKRIAAGEDFAKLAAEVSTSPSKTTGGIVGPINVSDVSATLQQLLQKMKPGDVTEPLRTAKGFQILKLEAIKPASIQPFDSVRDLVSDKVHDDRQDKEVRKFIARVRGQAIIQWKNEELRKAYERQVALNPTGGN
jgi:peptidyl-prolyl cis-trans isomerase SurA